MINEPGLTLAYIGDAVYELRIREYLISRGTTNVNSLHNSAIKYTSALAQSKIIEALFDTLSEEEMDYFKKGRNATTSHKPKSASLKEYRLSTGFESLIGYLYLKKSIERLDEIINFSIEYINKENC